MGFTRCLRDAGVQPSQRTTKVQLRLYVLRALTASRESRRPERFYECVTTNFFCNTRSLLYL